MVNNSTVLRRESAGLRRYTNALAPYAVTVMRILVGLTFLLTGLPKLQNFAGFTGFVGSLGFPAPVVFAAIVVALEVIGGLLLIVGLAVMIGGVVAQSILIGILGAVVMFAGLPLVALNYKSATGAAEAGSGAASGAAGPTGKGRGRAGRSRRQPLKNRLEERFRRRYDQ